MTNYRKRLGKMGEGLATGYLERRGYVVLAANYRSFQGEIDIVVREEGCSALVEVNARRSLDYGSPEESVTRASSAD